MSKFISQFRLKLILLECIAVIFIISGIDRMYIAFNGKKFDAIANDDFNQFESLTDARIGQFLVNQLYWTLASIIIGLIIIGIFNWKNKIRIINSLIVLIITLGIATTGIYSTGVLNKYLNYFCRIFAEGYGVSFLIGGIIIFLFGIFISWKTIKINRREAIKDI